MKRWWLSVAVYGCLAALIGASASPAQSRIITLQDDDEIIYSPIEEVADLAEIIGGAHFLRITCSGTSDQTWRVEMRELLDLEAPGDGSRRTRLIRAFNEGFRRQEARFGYCSSQVREAEVALAAQGRRVAQRLADRYLE